MPSRVLDAIAAEPWLIQPEWLETILSIAQRHNDNPEAVAAKLGRPLDNTRAVQMRGDVAVIPVRGPIFRYANLFTELSGATSLEVMATDLGQALEDRAVSRIVLDIDSPGGQAAGISEFAAMVRAADKPVTAYVGGMGASAAYWIAAAAHELAISDTAMLGSIGVAGTYRAAGGDEKEIKIISSQSPLKQANPETEAGRAEAQRVIDDLADVFINAVARYRGVERDIVLSDFGRGGVLIGAKAQAAGMADRLASLESIIAGAPGATHGRNSMTAKAEQPEVTRAYLAEHNPTLIEDIKTEGYEIGHQDGHAAGATAERERIQAVLAQALPGHEALVNELAFDGKTTGPEAAVAVLAAEKEGRAAHLQQMREGAPKPVPSASESEDSGKGADFEAVVQRYQDEGKTRGQAMALAARNHPELHKQWLARINTKSAG